MDVPHWLSALRADEDLTKRFELSYVEADVAEKIRELAHQAWEGKFDGEVAEAGHARIERSIPVGGGLVRKRRISGDEQTVALWLDPEEDQLFAGFTLLFPPALWLPLGTIPASVAAALAPYDVKEPAPVSSLPRVRRWLKQVAPSEREGIERVIDLIEPWIDDAKWANAHVEDPWARYEPTRNALARSAQLREAAEERAGRTPNTSCRTLWSRSVLTVEYHPFHCVFAARHAPVEITAPRAALDELAGDSVPSDVPLDVVASLLREGNVTVEELDRLRAEWAPAHTIARCALLPGEPAAGDDIRAGFDRTKDDPETRALFVQLARHYHHDWVLRDIAIAEPELVRAPDLAPHFEAHVPPSAEVSR